jgi:hypothetical protein
LFKKKAIKIQQKSVFLKINIGPLTLIRAAGGVYDFRNFEEA